MFIKTLLQWAYSQNREDNTNNEKFGLTGAEIKRFPKNVLCERSAHLILKLYIISCGTVSSLSNYLLKHRERSVIDFSQNAISPVKRLRKIFVLSFLFWHLNDFTIWKFLAEIICISIRYQSLLLGQRIFSKKRMKKKHRFVN